MRRRGTVTAVSGRSAGYPADRPLFSFAAILLGAIVAISLLPPPAHSASAATGLHELGRLPEPAKSSNSRIALVDSESRRLYYTYASEDRNFDTYIREYDLTSAVPTFLREGILGTVSELSIAPTVSPNTVAMDRRRNRLWFLSQDGSPVCDTSDPFCGSSAPAPVKIFIVDRRTLKRVSVVNVQLTIPGFAARGITYSIEDDRVYLIGELQPLGGPSLAEAGLGLPPRSSPVAVAAIDPEKGTRVWLRPVPECEVSMTTFRLGMAIVRSVLRPALYFGCVRTFVYPGSSGVARLWIDPKATAQDGLQAPLEFFPISGSYVNGDGVVGIASFDYATDRFFMQNRSNATPGTWVFDGRLSAWVGFLAAPDDRNDHAGLNQRTGRYYMGGVAAAGEQAEKPTGYIVVSEGRSTPLPQGRVATLRKKLWAPIYTDGVSNRLFLQMGPEHLGAPWYVYEDRSPSPPVPSEVDYDTLTSGLPEGPNTISVFAGDVNGFGANVVLVGGTGGLIDTTCVVIKTAEFGCETVKEAFKDLFNVSPSPGDRALLAAWVPSLDLRNVGASASAKALGLDHVSDGEYATVVVSIAERARAQSKTQAEAIEKQLTWPHREAACLDAGDQAGTTEETGQGGGSEVGCDLGKVEAHAISSYTGFSIPGVSVAFASFEARSKKDPKLGIVTESISVARGVELAAPGGSVTVARVTVRAETAAGGRPGTASATYKRTLEGVVVRDVSGAVVFECSQGADCDPEAAIREMNVVLKTRMRLTLPEAKVTATAGGAYAAVEESDANYYDDLITNNDTRRSVPGLELVLYNDTDNKSRLLIQLAAVQSSSIYGINPLPDTDVPPPGGEPIPLPTVGAGLLPPTVIGGATLPPPPGNVGTGLRQIARTAFLLLRSPKDALLFGLTVLLFAAAAGAAWRRRLLLRSLSGS